MKNMQLKKINGLEMYIRPETQDEFVVKENDYLKMIYNEEDIWLDAGSNIGAFVCKFHHKVKQIIAFEPDNENFDLLTHNMVHNNVKNVIAIKKAIVGNDDETRDFYINTKTNKGTHTLIPKRGRDKVTVQCQNINNILETYNINKIKLDVEGGEYEILKVMNFNNIKEIIMEYHFQALKDDDKSKYNEIINILENNGFSIANKINPDSKNWATIIIAKK